MASRALVGKVAGFLRVGIKSPSLLIRPSAAAITCIRKESIFKKQREPPNGFLFNERPLKPGEKREWENWEGIFYRWMVIIGIILAVGFYYKPDTRPQVYARPEALRRIAALEAAEAAESGLNEDEGQEEDED